MLALLAITYVATLILEWPFVAYCLRKSQGWVSKSLRANLLAQTVSYLGLIAWYALASYTTLYTDIRVVPSSRMQVPAGAVLYYIAAADGDVYRQEVPTGPAEKVYPLKSTSGDDTLFVRKSTVDPNRWDLFARQNRSDSEAGKDVVIKNVFSSAAASPWEQQGWDAPVFVDHWHGPALRLGTQVGSQWDFGAYFTAGLVGTPKSGGRPIRLLVETPFIEWQSCNVTQLPGDKVIFQLGQDQICLLDPQLRQVALLAHGRGPVVVLDDTPPAASQPRGGGGIGSLPGAPAER
jgi:hypothetical protein